VRVGKPLPQPGWSDNNLEREPLEVIKWAPHLPFTKEVSSTLFLLVFLLCFAVRNFFVEFSICYQLTRMREPIVLKNTMVANWKALTDWQKDGYLMNHPVRLLINFFFPFFVRKFLFFFFSFFSFLRILIFLQNFETLCSKALALMEGVEVGPVPTFGHIDNRTKLAKRQEFIPKLQIRHHYQTVNMTGPEFFRRISDVTDPNYYYWYGKVRGGLVEDVTPHRNLWVNPSDKDQFGLFMWLSGNDTRPPIHYDQDHNFFVHISGM
jgi:hypothetical protein